MTGGDAVAASFLAGITTIPFYPLPRRLSRRSKKPVGSRPWPRWGAHFPSGLPWPYWLGWPAPISCCAALTTAPPRPIVSRDEAQLVAVTIEQDILVLDCVGDELLTIYAQLDADLDKTDVRRRAQAWLNSTTVVSVRRNINCEQPSVEVIDDRCTTTLPVVSG